MPVGGTGPHAVRTPSRGRTGPGAAVVLGRDAHERTVHAGRVASSGGLDTDARDTARARRTRVLTGLAGLALAVRPDGRLLAGDNHMAALPSGPVTDRGLVTGEEVGALAFSADGSRPAAGGVTGRVALWDGRLRQRVGILRNVFPAPLGELPEQVGEVALSPGGRTPAVGGEAGTLQLWDTESRQPLGTPLTTPGEAVASLSFGPDGTTVHAAGPHVPLQRYVIVPGRAVAEVRARAGGVGPTRAQCRTYLGHVPCQ